MSNKLNKIQRAEAVQQVFSIEPNQAQFNASLDQLNDFISAQLAGEEYETLFPGVAAYLDTDPELAEIYDRLYQLEVDTRGNNLRTPSSKPQFDLSFLSQPPRGVIPPWLHEISLENSMKWLREILEKHFIAGTLDLTSPTPALSLRGDSDREPQQYTYFADPYHLFISITPGIVAQTEAQIDGNVMNEQDMDENYEGKAHLFRDQVKVQEVALDEFGFFGLDKVEAGRYCLLVELATHTIWVEDLNVP